MVNDPVSVRYAEALFDLAKREGRLDELAQELQELAELITQHAELSQFLLNPDVDPPDKLRVLERVMQDAWSKDLRAFVQVVLGYDRAAQLVEMAQAMRDLVDKERRIVRVTVRTASALSAPLKQRLTQWISKREGAQVRLIEEVDRGLLGGIQIMLDHRTFDGSLRTQLSRLRQRLKSVRVH